MNNLNRRQFMKAAGIAAGTLAIGGCLPAAAGIKPCAQNPPREPSGYDVISDLCNTISSFQYQVRGTFERENYFILYMSENVRDTRLRRPTLSGMTATDFMREMWPNHKLSFLDEQSINDLKRTWSEKGTDRLYARWEVFFTEIYQRGKVGQEFLMAHQSSHLGLILVNMFPQWAGRLSSFGFIPTDDFRPVHSA